MKKNTSVLLVENNLTNYRQLEGKILQTGFCRQIRPALNGGHAYLYVEQLHLSERIKETNLIILLNLNTPIVDGIEFLEKFKSMNSPYKENINIMILQDDASAEQLEKVKKMGFNQFINRSAVDSINLFPNKKSQNKKQVLN